MDSNTLHAYLPARCVADHDTPWIPSGTPGKSAKPLRFLADNRGFVELLRMEPGVVMPLHRHSGEIHAYNLSGSRRLCTGEVIGPGGYVYEPPGNVDWWKVVGDEPLLALVVVMGEVDFLRADGSVCGHASAATQRRDYEAWCRGQGLPVADLAD